jgi:riboflavin biosynthesis pyrimidine reductase
VRPLIGGPASPPTSTDGILDPYADLVLAPSDASRPWIALGMVASVDGAAAVDGRTQRLGGEADHVAFRALRDAADVVLVGATTVRAERYGPGVPDVSRQRRRAAKGLAPTPRMVVVSASADLPEDLPLLGPREAGTPPPVLLVPVRPDPAAEARLARLEGRLEVRRAGGTDLRGQDIVRALEDLGARGVLCEGGPSLAGLLLGEDLIDEVFLTIAPVVALGDGPRIATAPRAAAAGDDALREMELVEAWEHRSELLLRYRRSGSRGSREG